MVATLRSAHCSVHQAHDALAALEVTLGLGTIDLLITDASWPRVKGPQLIWQVREKMPTLQILHIANLEFLPGTAPDELPPDVPTLREPFTSAELLNAVRALWQRHGPRIRRSSRLELLREEPE
jgi:CheY-like chemotaxis protein